MRDLRKCNRILIKFALAQFLDNESLGDLQPNYAFLVTKKLRQRGISLIVGSSSSGEKKLPAFVIAVVSLVYYLTKIQSNCKVNINKKNVFLFHARLCCSCSLVSGLLSFAGHRFPEFNTSLG